MYQVCVRHSFAEVFLLRFWGTIIVISAHARGFSCSLEARMKNRLSLRAWVMLTLMVVCRDERAEGETCRRSCSVLGICTSMAVTK
jgi:hypothetical protein